MVVFPVSCTPVELEDVSKSHREKEAAHYLTHGQAFRLIKKNLKRAMTDVVVG